MNSLLSDKAWAARENAQLYKGHTRVGCAIRTDDLRVWTGANIELPFNHGLHAEVAAIASASWFKKGFRLAHVLLAADREPFAPCGACMDWIMFFSGGKARVIHESAPGVVAMDVRADELMPHYPR